MSNLLAFPKSDMILNPGRFIKIVAIILFSVFLWIIHRKERNDDFTRKYTSHYENAKEISKSKQVIRRRLGELTKESVTTKTLESVKEALQQVLSLIYQRYELDSRVGGNFFTTISNIDKKTWDIIKWKLATKIVGDRNINQTFLMIFSGSSVTAGHDNFYNQSYPYIFKRRMTNVFEMLGIDLQIHNIAQGANNCLPYVFCYESMGGMNPDFLNWEQSYNCGRDTGIFEATARMAGFGGPSVVYYSASGAWLPDKCPPSPDPVPYCAEEWIPAKDIPISNDFVQSQKNKLLKFNEKKASADRFIGPFRADYKSVGTFGFNVWESNELCKFVNPKNNKTETCNGIDAAEGCTLKFMSKEASVFGSDSGKGANWHPSRAFHMLRGEAIVWIYALVLYELAETIEQDLLAKKDVASLFQDYSKKLAEFDKPLPTPKHCNNYRCEKRPLCYTDYKPHYSKNFSLSEIIANNTDWAYDSADPSQWSLHYGYLDFKPSYSSKTKEQGEIHIAIEIKNTNYVWLCGTLLKDNLVHAQFMLDVNTNIDTQRRWTYEPSDKRQLWTKKKYIGGECKEIYDLPKGRHVLSVSNTGDHPIGLTHVIMWP